MRSGIPHSRPVAVTRGSATAADGRPFPSATWERGCDAAQLVRCGRGRGALDEGVVFRGEIVDLGEVNLAVGLGRVENAAENPGGGKEILQRSGEDDLLPFG